jgi:hypothetical protein
MDEVLEQEYRKGEIAGIEFAARFVDIEIEILRETISKLTQEVDKDENSEVSLDGVNSGDGRLDLDTDPSSSGFYGNDN